MIRPTSYSRTDGSTNVVGEAELRLPLLELWQQFEPRYVKATIQALLERRAQVEIDEFLEQVDLTSGTVRLASWFGHLEKPPRKVSPRCVRDLHRLARDAEDYADDEGSWRQWRDDMREAGKVAYCDLCERMDRAVDKALADHGPRTARQVVDYLRLEMHGQCQAWDESTETWKPDRSAQLRRAADQLRGLAVPRRLLWRLCLTWRPDLPPRLWSGERERRDAEKLAEDVRFAAAARYQRDLCAQRTAVLKKLLGSDGAQGHLDEVCDRIERHERLFGELSESLGQTPPRLTSGGSRILLVDHIDAVIHTARGLTLAQLYAQQVVRAGCHPRILAERLWQEGLEINHRRHHPNEWLDCNPGDVRRALLEAARGFLGSHDLSVRLDIENPTTAFEHVAAITPTHPALAPLLERRIPDWVKRSLPYAQFPKVKGAKPAVQCYLLCYPKDRAIWERQLANHVRPSAPPTDRKDYDTSHPFAAVLIHLGFGFPGHAQPALLRGRYLLQMREAAGKLPPLYAANGQPERRLLCERPADCTHATEMFAGLLAAQAIRALNTDPPRYALASPEPSLDHHFTTSTIQPEWQTAGFFRELLQTPQFKSFVELHFPGIPDWSDLCLRLQDDPRPGYVARELALRGILESGESGQYRMAGSPPQDITSVPQGLYSQRRGKLVGLTRGEFIAALQSDDDWFYTVMFWRVADAFAQGRLAPHEAPDFLLGYIEDNLS